MDSLSSIQWSLSFSQPELTRTAWSLINEDQVQVLLLGRYPKVKIPASNNLYWRVLQIYIIVFHSYSKNPHCVLGASVHYCKCILIQSDNSFSFIVPSAIAIKVSASSPSWSNIVYPVHLSSSCTTIAPMRLFPSRKAWFAARPYRFLLSCQYPPGINPGLQMTVMVLLLPLPSLRNPGYPPFLLWSEWLWNELL